MSQSSEYEAFHTETRSRSIRDIISLQTSHDSKAVPEILADAEARHTNVTEPDTNPVSKVTPPSFVASEYLVCPDPNIWVFDGLLSDNLLSHIDSLFVSRLDNAKAVDNLDGRSVCALELDIDEHSEELIHVLCEISHIDAVEPCCKAWILDVSGSNQGPHMDRVNLRAFGDPSHKTVQFVKSLELSTQSNSLVIPTLSFVVYFNDIGGCIFPQAAVPNTSISGKRGRIIMFQNYIDTQRPAHNPAAVHYGIYADGEKRVMTAGMLSSVTPPTLFSSQPWNGLRTPGVIYCPNGHDYYEGPRPWLERTHPLPGEQGYQPRAEQPRAVQPRAPQPSQRQEWWWLQGEHKLPVAVLQWKMYAPGVQPLLTAGHEALQDGARDTGLIFDMAPAPYQVRRAQLASVANSTVPDMLGDNMIAGLSAAFWDLPPSQRPPSPLLQAGRGCIVEGYYQVHQEDAAMAASLAAWLGNSSSPPWPYPDRPFPRFPRRRVVLLIEAVDGLPPSVQVRDSPEEAAAKRSATAMFNRYNVNGNGRMTRDEMAQMLRLTDPNWPEPGIDNQFSMVDSNSDGFIDAQEFVRWALTPESVASVLLAIEE